MVAPRCHFPLVTIASDFPFLVHIFSLSCISFPGPQGQPSPVASFPHPYPSHRLGSGTVIQEATTLGPSELQPGLCHSLSTCFPCTSPAREREVVEGTFWPQACFLWQKTSKGSVAEERAAVCKQENRIAFVC